MTHNEALNFSRLSFKSSSQKFGQLRLDEDGGDHESIKTFLKQPNSVFIAAVVLMARRQLRAFIPTCHNHAPKLSNIPLFFALKLKISILIM